MKNSKFYHLKKIIGFCVLLFVFNNSRAQLILDGNFESVTAYAEVINPGHNTTWWNSSTMYPQYWHDPTDGTSDIYSDFSNSNNVGPCSDPNFPSSTLQFPTVCSYDNIMGCQSVRNPSPISHNYMGFGTAGAGLYTTNFREYIQTTIAPGNPSQTLVRGQCYVLDFYVSLADECGQASTIQVLVSGGSTPPSLHSTTNVPYQDLLPTNYPNSQLLQTPVVDDKVIWVHERLPFIALGGEKYITIGFFESEADGHSRGHIIPSTSASSAQCNPSWGQSDPNGAYYYIDDVSLNPDAGLFPANATYSGNPTVYVSGNWNIPSSNQNVLLNGNVILNGNLTMTDCTVKCTQGTTITVPQGKTLTINGTSITAGCNHMWGGIIVQPGGIIRMNSTSQSGNSSIEDALMALDFNGGSWQIFNSNFNKNVRDIHFSNVSIGYGYFIKGVTFDHSQFLNDQTLTPNGKGLYGINISNMFNTSNPMDIGGTNSTDVCKFIGGQFGIQSVNANVNVTQCTFQNILATAIDFQGTNATLKRTLAVTNGCTFTNNFRHIRSTFKTNLTVQSSTFTGSSEHAILWCINHDCILMIGDPTDVSKGNTFINNNWSAVYCSENRTFAAVNNHDLATGQANQYTNITIANNHVNGPQYATGFIITEPTLGSNVSYQSISVSNNTITNIFSGIELSNVRGYGGAFPNAVNFTIPPTTINRNQIGISTLISPVAKAISIINAPGLNVSQNGIGSDAPQNWQNKGIFLQNSENSEIVSNAIGTGIGICAGLDMMWSNIHCNHLVSNVSGIVLGYECLRPLGYLHGSVQEAFANDFILDQPYTIDIHNYFSPINLNQWVWTLTANSSYPKVWDSSPPGFETNLTGNTSTSMISIIEGDFKCPGDIYKIQYAGGVNVPSVLNDTNAQWRYDYNYQVEKDNTGQGNSNYSSANIKRIIRVENAIGSGQYALASAQLNGLNPSNSFEQNYKDVLTILVNIKSPVERDLNVSEIATLTSIATQFSRIAGPAVTLARSVLFFQLHLTFGEEDYSPSTKVTGTAFIQSPCCLTPASGTTLAFADQYGNELPIAGALVYQDGSFAFDPYQLRYYAQQNPNTVYRIVAKSPSKFTPLDKIFKTLTDWVASSPIVVTLGGAKIAATTVTATQDTVIASVTSLQDAFGNTYSIGVATLQTADFLVQKVDSTGQLLWSKTFDGAASGNDTATCITLDNQGSVYVAGKVWNGNHYNYQAVKYDSIGDMQWATEIADTLPRENKPTGIAVNNSDETVWMIGRCCSQSGTQYRKAELQQCIHASSSRIMNPQQTEPTPISLIEYYPNPSGGSLNIVLKNISGGKLELFNLNGQLVFTQQITQTTEINLPADLVPDGVYLLKFTSISAVPQFSKVVIHRN